MPIEFGSLYLYTPAILVGQFQGKQPCFKTSSFQYILNWAQETNQVLGYCHCTPPAWWCLPGSPPCRSSGRGLCNCAPDSSGWQSRGQARTRSSSLRPLRFWFGTRREKTHSLCNKCFFNAKWLCCCCCCCLSGRVCGMMLGHIPPRPVHNTGPLCLHSDSHHLFCHSILVQQGANACFPEEAGNLLDGPDEWGALERSSKDR